MAYLLDTNVISETRKPRKSDAVMTWLGAQRIEDLRTSTVNMAELLYGIETLEDILKRRTLERWIADVVRPWLQGRIAEVSENALLRWRLLIRNSQISEQRAPEIDLLIAAVAYENGLTVATRDTAPYAACGIPALNPWTGERFNGA